jgi:hypothetical protein
LVTVWPALPDPIRKAVMAMIQERPMPSDLGALIRAIVEADPPEAVRKAILAILLAEGATALASCDQRHHNGCET